MYSPLLFGEVEHVSFSPDVDGRNKNMPIFTSEFSRNYISGSVSTVPPYFKETSAKPDVRCSWPSGEGTSTGKKKKGSHMDLQCNLRLLNHVASFIK